MKKQFTIFAIIIFLFTSCENFLGLKNQSKTTLTISLPKSRAVYAKGEVSKYSVTVKYLGDEEPLFGDITKTVEAGESVLFEEVQAGLNLVQILAYNSIDKVIAKGETEVDVIEEQENAVTVIMHLLSDEEYKGDDLEDETPPEDDNPQDDDSKDDDPPAEDPPAGTPKIYISENASGSGDGSKENPFTVQQGLSDVKDGTEVYVLSDLSLDSAMIIASVKIIGSKEGTGEPISVKYGGETTRILSLGGAITLENIIFDGENKEKGTAPFMVNQNVTFNKCEFRNFNIVSGGTSVSSKGILYVGKNYQCILNGCVFENFPDSVNAISIDANGYCELNNTAILPVAGAASIFVEEGGKYQIDGTEGIDNIAGAILIDYPSLIENAKPGETIKLFHDFNIEEGFMIADDLTIDGNGKKITRVSEEGMVNSPAFYVMYKQTLKISGLTIDCNSIEIVDVSVAGIENAGTLILEDCKILNIPSEKTGIVNNENSSYDLKNVTVGTDEINEQASVITQEKSF